MDALHLNEPALLTTLLSDEVLLHIVQFLDFVDVINLSGTCRKLESLLKDRTICGNVNVTWNMKVDRLVLMKFLRNPERAAVVTKLNLSDMYWIPSGVLKDITKSMINLKTLHTLGTNLSFLHLVEILGSLRSLENLSWSWDHKLEWPKSEGTGTKLLDISTANTVEKICDAAIGTDTCIPNLKSLVVEVSGIQNFNYPNYIAHTGLSHLISLCQSLEHLWIFSWPKTEMEKRLLEIFADDSFPSDFALPKLKSFGMRALNDPRIFSPKLITGVIKNIGANQDADNLADCLWLDHPLMNFRGVRDRCLHPWPRLMFDHVEYLSIPLMEGTETWLERNAFKNLRHLKITDGLPRIINLNGVFDTATELQSVVITAFNIKLDWNRFVEMHPKLTTVNLCQDGNFVYPDLFVALSRLTGLKKLSLPLFSLIEICNSAIVDSYRASLAISAVPITTTELNTAKILEEPLFKRHRVALLPKSETVSGAISGLDLVTIGCSQVAEFELGFSTKSSPGIIVVSSLLSISRWRNLKSLTIEGAPVKNGRFLLDICKACPLETLSLKDLGSRAKCCYADDLCCALPFLKNLKDFRFEQNYIGSTAKLFNSLLHCVRLERFLLWSKSNDQALDSESCFKLMSSCPNLIMLYILIGGTTKSTCETVRKIIEGKYRQSRPGLSIKIRRGLDVLEETASPIIYPSVHYRDMVVMCPRIGQINDTSVIS